jgi:hypothetical protein
MERLSAVSFAILLTTLAATGLTSPVRAQATSPETRVTRAFVRNLCRDPSPTEMTAWLADPRSANVDEEDLNNVIHTQLQSNAAAREGMVRRAFEIFYDRAPSAEAMANWDGQASLYNMTCLRLLSTFAKGETTLHKGGSAPSAPTEWPNDVVVFYSENNAGGHFDYGVSPSSSRREGSKVRLKVTWIGSTGIAAEDVETVDCKSGELNSWFEREYAAPPNGATTPVYSSTPGDRFTAVDSSTDGWRASLKDKVCRP